MARQRSRNTTPSSIPPTASLPPIETVETEYLDLKFDLFRTITYEDLVDPSGSNAVIPDSKSLDGIVSRLQRLQDLVEKRGTYCDRGMRVLAQRRKTRMEAMAAERGREEERLRREAEEEERERRANKKKRKATDNLVPQERNAGQCRISLGRVCFSCVLFLTVIFGLRRWRVFCSVTPKTRWTMADGDIRAVFAVSRKRQVAKTIP